MYISPPSGQCRILPFQLDRPADRDCSIGRSQHRIWLAPPAAQSAHRPVRLAPSGLVRMERPGWRPGGPRGVPAHALAHPARPGWARLAATSGPRAASPRTRPIRLVRMGCRTAATSGPRAASPALAPIRLVRMERRVGGYQRPPRGQPHASPPSGSSGWSCKLAATSGPRAASPTRSPHQLVRMSAS